MKKMGTVKDLLKHVENNFNYPKAFNYYSEGLWHTLSTKEFIQEIVQVTLGLIKLGVKPGEKIGVFAPSSTRWTIVDFAIMLAGAISIPIFINISNENLEFILKETNLTKIFVEGEEQWLRAVAQKGLIHFISLDQQEKKLATTSYQALKELGRANTLEKLSLDLLPDLSSEQIATIIYTSGSTGIPKGVIHTYKSLTCLLHLPLFDWEAGKDTYLSVLPLAHILARTLNTWMIGAGVRIYYYNDLKNIVNIAQELQPTIMGVVPRLLEKMYARIIFNLEQAKGVKAFLGSTIFQAVKAKKGWLFYPLIKNLVEKLFYKPLRQILGGRLQIVVTGGAPLDKELNYFYSQIGIPVYEGWGLTEACPVCVNTKTAQKFGTVGKPITGVEVKTSVDNELLVKGEIVMQSYYQNELATKNTFIETDWLATGDLGHIDKEGYVTIIGRKKEILKTSNGEIVAPIPIEQALCENPLIDRALVVGNAKKFAACLLVPDLEILHHLKENTHLTHLSDEAFLESEEIKQMMEKILNLVNKKLNHWEQLHAYRFILSPLTVENGALTPSMKLRRAAMEIKYKTIIDEMYL